MAPTADPDQRSADSSREPQAGDVYRHFKGSMYAVVGVATGVVGAPTRDVVYFPLEDPGRLWSRPIEDFMAAVERDGTRQLRFALVEQTDG